MSARSQMKWQKIRSQFLHLFRLSVQTSHNRIVTCGLIIFALYLPAWLSSLIHGIAAGSTNLFLNGGFIALGIERLWKRRRQLVSLEAYEDERWLGYIFILGPAAIFPFCLSSVSLQALICMVIAIGIAFSSWGLRFFRNYLLSVALLLISIYPDLGFLGNTVRRTLAPNLLESFMAWAGSIALTAIGQPAVAQGSLLSLSKGSVEVASGCSGFDMAFTLAGTGLIMGLFFKQRGVKIVTLILAGVLLALILNIPRIMLVTIAAVYWGHESFEFWHGPWGGQMFATLLFTIYYYLVMGLVNQKPQKASSQ